MNTAPRSEFIGALDDDSRAAVQELITAPSGGSPDPGLVADDFKFFDEADKGVQVAIKQLSDEDSDFKDHWNSKMTEADRNRYTGYCIQEVVNGLDGARTSIEMMREGFRESYTCEISEPEEGGSKMIVSLRDQVLHEIDLTTLNGIEEATATQWASIVIESIFLAISVFTLRLPRPTGTQMSTMATAVKASISNSALKTALSSLKAVKPEASWAFAKAIYGVISASKSAGLLGKIVKIMFYELAWWEYVVIGVQVVGYIGAAVATGGAALVAKIVVILADAFWFFKKITNISDLEQRHRTLLGAE